MDVCSPGEVEWALEHGWREDEISYTGTNLSDRDLDVILAHPDVHLNVDLLTQIDRVGRRSPGRTIGIRVNPRGGAGFGGGGGTLYSGPRPTKFGIFRERLPEALAVARRHDLTIDTVHLHVGDGYLDDGLPEIEEVLRRVAEMVRILQGEGCPIVEVNTGGGLGVPQVADDRPLDLDRWASILAAHLGPLGVAVGTEPRRLPGQRVRDQPGRGRHRRGPGRRALRGLGRRMERDGRALHLSLAARPRALSRGRRARRPRRDDQRSHQRGRRPVRGRRCRSPTSWKATSSRRSTWAATTPP